MIKIIVCFYNYYDNTNMESTASNIFVDSCQYTPVYFLDDPSITRANSYFVPQNNSNIQKPVSDNLKKFYENSGKLENNLYIPETNTNTKPSILKKLDNNVVGNNLKLASFLLPKCESTYDSAQMSVPTNNVILKPVYIANTPNIVNTIPKLDINSKIVKLKEMPNITRTPNGKIVPKIKPKETTSNSKHTSVQLLKLGETYHSLNQLSEEQMKIVNHALKIFTKKPPQKPTYDPVTNTKFIYKVVSPKDLTVVGKNNILLTQKKPMVKKIVKKIEKKEPIVKEAELDIKTFNTIEKKEQAIKDTAVHIKVQKKKDHILLDTNKDIKKLKRIEKKDLPVKDIISDVRIPVFLENAVTRSGRKVKISKNILQEEIPNKTRRKIPNVLTCHHCLSKFSSAHRLQRHYEFHPTHVSERIHSNLFQCFLAIIKSGPKENSANVFFDQLEQFINKLRSCTPCLVKADADCTNDQSRFINDDVSRLLGINPGKYNVNLEGLECERDQSGHCEHNPPQSHITEPILWFIKPSDVPEQSDNVCMVTNTIEKSPNIKRVETRQHYDECLPTKKMKVHPSDDVSCIADNNDDIVKLLSDTIKTEHLIEKNIKSVDPCNIEMIDSEYNTVFDRSKANHIQFRSTHFDIRSSPIKPSTNTFSKFQINTENMSNYKVHIIQPLQLDQVSNEHTIDNSNGIPTKQLYKDNVEIKNSLEQLSEIISKEWSNEQNSLIEESNIIQPNLIHVKDNLHNTEQNINAEQDLVCENNGIIIPDQILTDQEHSIDALNFLESLGNECIYPETEIRNNSVDFHLDLFSFDNT